MTIAVGDRLPSVTFKTMKDGVPAAISTDEVFKGKTVALFAVPGAFTPTCSKSHLPGYLENAAALHGKGVDTIACPAVNDVFVMDAWAKASGAESEILFLADGSADFAKAIGLTLDLTAGGLGLRSQRYSMIVVDGVVKDLAFEEKAGVAELTGGACMVGKF
ncbi:MAG: peroxiredoxin [Phyllobacteriaceae bacterium]|nr:peroxiredoxin [Phyllobacteriaceae bacterium]